MSDNLVIVALPRKGEAVNDVSSEKAAHVTLLFLGESSDISPEVVQYVEHCVTTAFRPIWLETTDRGELGPDKADVLFFDGSGSRQLTEFRSLLLKDPNIKRLYDAVEQYPKYTPHLTLGYPESPAKEPENDWMLTSVEVDRIAVWTEDSDGPEFKPPRIDWDDEYSYPVAMGETIVGDTLAHYGKKGMKWGVRKGKDSSGNTVVKVGKDKAPQAVETAVVKVGPRSTVVGRKGGHNEVHPDAIAAKSALQKKRRSGVDTLSNKELETLATRMNLEQRIADMSSKRNDSRKKLGKNFIKNMDETSIDDPKKKEFVQKIKKQFG